jgi:hypothetical protein
MGAALMAKNETGGPSRYLTVDEDSRGHPWKQAPVSSDRDSSGQIEHRLDRSEHLLRQDKNRKQKNQTKANLRHDHQNFKNFFIKMNKMHIQP